MRKIFLSFTSTLGLMAEGKVTEADFEKALFYFGCARVHALETPPAKIQELDWTFGDRVKKGREALRKLQKTLKLAEQEGRVAWRPLEGGRSNQQLSELLLANNARPLNPNLPPACNDSEFLAQAIIAANTPAGTQLLHPVF